MKNTFTLVLERDPESNWLVGEEDLQDLALMAERNAEPTESLDVVRKRLEEKWQSTAPRYGLETTS